MKKNLSRIAIFTISATLLAQTALADVNRFLANAKTNDDILIHTTHVNTFGKTMTLQVSLGMGTGKAGACQIENIEEGQLELTDEAVSLKSKAVTAAGLQYTCMKETYISLANNSQASIEYNLIKNKEGTAFIDTNPNDQIIYLESK